jgi:hypothetical protein
LNNKLPVERLRYRSSVLSKSASVNSGAGAVLLVAEDEYFLDQAAEERCLPLNEDDRTATKELKNESKRFTVFKIKGGNIKLLAFRNFTNRWEGASEEQAKRA